jgi:putative transposase
MTKLTHSAERLPELLKLPILWTHSYFISTAGHVPAKTIHEYVEMESRR